MARVHAHLRSMGPKMDSISLRYFGLGSSQPLRLALVDPTDKYLRAWKPIPSCLHFDQQRVPSSPSFSLFQRPPFSTPWRDEMPRLRSWKLKPNPTAIREGRTGRKTALSTTGNTIRRLRGVKIRCWTATCHGPSWECRKTRFSEISQHPMRLMLDITVFTKEWRLPI